MSIITVTTTADSGNGSLRNAIATAKSGDTIQFSNRLANKTITLRTGQLVLDKDLTIDGGRAPGLTVSGNQSSRVFYLNRKKTAVLRNLTIANGKTMGAGGGIDTRHESTITLDNVKVHNNTSELGGGMRVGHLAKATILNSSFKGNDGTLTGKHKGFSSGAIVHNESRGQLIIKGTSFENNKGFNGGAIYSFSSTTFTVEDSTFLNNVAKNRAGGGAIMTDGVSSKNYNSGLKNDGKIIIKGSRFEGNRAEGLGGALYLWGYGDDQAIIKDTVIVNNTVDFNRKNQAKGGGLWVKMKLNMDGVTVAGNTAQQQGGGLWLESRQPAAIVNSTFSGNEAVRDAGGAMFLNNSSNPVNITNSTIAYNEAGRANGALWFDRRGQIKLKNSIVAFNTARKDRRQDQVGFRVIDNGGNLEFSLSRKAMRMSSKSLVADPLLQPLERVDGVLIHTLASDSPAIDAGVRKGTPELDQRGLDRDKQPDIGAFEYVEKTSHPIVQPPMGSVAYFDFDQTDGNVVRDRSLNGKSHTGKLVGRAKLDPGLNGNALYLSGNQDGIRIGNSSDINLDTHRQRTISLTFKASELNTGKQVLYEEGGKKRGLNIYIDKDRLYVGGWNNVTEESSWKGTWLSTSKVSEDQWHQVELVLDGGKAVAQDAIRGYIDGEQFGSGAGSQLWRHSGGIGVGAINSGTLFHDGIQASKGAGFTGVVDEVAIFNDALTNSEISALL
ncbi:LamG domain-containing protein [cf. Phormidesmis sp. LEGE 11477]|uniref:LamG domain-containing protein n=1 Tax=cf. Phormidesmis sp. LEGE 11477 TaxID=1828680 RepID=UPI0018819C46|nr:LamG domain-containing protein [cf. Phormidesmis sp. LEGE 11477]MBE9061267.1 hypothetical protein [cf. Phormidesmis sp. LEGE 11477]